jgi:hypothetical protein
MRPGDHDVRGDDRTDTRLAEQMWCERRRWPLQRVPAFSQLCELDVSPQQAGPALDCQGQLREAH